MEDWMYILNSLEIHPYDRNRLHLAIEDDLSERDKQSYEDGREAGAQDGYDEGYNEGYETGYETAEFDLKEDPQ